MRHARYFQPLIICLALALGTPAFAQSKTKQFNGRTDVAPEQQVKINRLMSDALRTGAAKSAGVTPGPDTVYTATGTAADGRSIISATPGVQAGCSQAIANLTADSRRAGSGEIIVAARGDIINYCR